MKNRRIFKALFGTILCIISFTGYGQQVKVMSYNVGSTNWATTQDSVIGRILANDPEVLCAVELGQLRRPYLESSLTNYRLLQTFGSTPNLCESHIFLKKNTFSVIDSGYVQMPTYVGYSSIGRYLNWARLQHNTTQQEFMIYASHFLAPVGANSDSAKIGQYRHADKMMEQMYLDTNLHIPQITVGDFNAGASSDVLQFLINQVPITFNSTTITNSLVLDDSWDINIPTAKPSTVFAGSGSIDWILVTPNTNVLSGIVDDQGVNNTIPPSDHKPLQITIDLSFPNSIDESQVNQSLNVYPNPFVGEINFEYSLINSKQIQIELYDINGKLWKTKTENSNIQKTIFVVDCSHLPNGPYFYKFKNESDNFTGKIIKANKR